MTDIVERLRERLLAPDADHILEEAADEIERLRAFGCEVISLVAAARREGIEEAVEVAARYPEENGASRHTAAGMLAAIRALLEEPGHD